MSPKNKVGRGNKNLGNEVGFSTRFQPGTSGNPGGRPSRTPFADAARSVADLPVDELKHKPTDSVAIRWAKRLASDALSGKTLAAAELANRAEGTPRRTEPFPERDPLFERLAELTAELGACENRAGNSEVNEGGSSSSE